jgi:hypothetical protein
MSLTATSTTNTNKCPHCGFIHDFTCPRIKAIDYHPDGTIKHIEFHEPGSKTGPVAQKPPIPIPALPGA